MAWGFESRPAHQHNRSPQGRHIMAVNVETLDKLERKITLTLPVDDHPVRSRLPPEEAGAHRQDGRLPSRQGADDRRGPALRLLGALRGHERQGRRGLLAGRQRSQAARGRPAPHHREGRARPKAQLAFDAIFEVYPEVKIGDLSAAEIDKHHGRSERRRHRQDARHPAQAAPHLRAARAGRRRRRTATA